VYLVSRCGHGIQEKTSLWLQHHDFYGQTGVASSKVMFCLERHQKADICAQHGITHFIDDRIEVLSHLKTVRTRYLFNPRENEIHPYEHVLPEVRLVRMWQEVLDELLTTST
jgi:hypothetical protein